MASESKQHGNIVTVESLRRAIQDATYVVINREYFTEFQSSLGNIREIVGQFHGKKQVLSFQDVDEILSDVKFDFSSRSVTADRIQDKLAFLYQTGFLGVYADNDLRERLNLTFPHAFFFNEGAAPLRILQHGGALQPRIIIHPIFGGYLGLDTSGNELIFNFTWEYLHELEASLFEAGDGFLWEQGP